MEKTNALKKRINCSFGIISLFSIVLTLNSVISIILYFIAQFLISSFNWGDVAYAKADFYIMFVIPQFFYPIVTALVACLIPILGKFKIRDCFKSEKVPGVYFILCIFISPGLSTVFSYISYALTYLLNLIGIPIADINSAIPTPDGVLETVLLFLVMAVLPAICEEFIYRGVLLRGLSEYGKVGAIVVSSFAFGLMHATVQQIPFAFAIGLFLGYVSLRFKSLLLPIILHFINNFMACVLILMQNYMDSELFAAISACMDIFFVTVSILALAIFVILTIHDRKADEVECSLKSSDTVESEFETSEFTESNVSEPKIQFGKAVFHSWGFWLFTVIYIFTTISNVIAMALSVT